MGMRTIGLFGIALLGATALTAPAHAGDFDVTAEGFAAVVDSTATFINADKLPNDVSGEFYGIRLGAEYTFENGLFFGADYYTTGGDGTTSAPVRNGNYLVHYTEFTGFSGYEVLAGWNFGHLALGVSYGQMERDATSYQSCPEDSDGVPFGFCGNAAQRQFREGLRGGSPQDNEADSLRIFARYDITDNWGVTLSHQTADFGQSISPLDVIANAENNAAGNRTAHGPTSFEQDFSATMLGIQVRY